MTHKTQVATVFGGTGFIGRQIVRELAARGLVVKVATRVPERAYFLKPCGAVGQVVPFACDYTDMHSIQSAVRGSDYVINCIGVLFEKGKKQKFQKQHVDIPVMIAKACADENVGRFVHISALGCDSGQSKYAKSKYDGEKALSENYSGVTILRPSVVFGEDDNFFNMFAELARYLPFLPLIGGGKTKFQPVYVGDVADAAMEVALSFSGAYQGKVYQLGGPDVVDFTGVYERISRYTGRQRRLISYPYWLAKFEAFFLSFLPKPLLTVDQVESLKHDNIVGEGALGFSHLGIEPKSMDLILPSYLSRYKSGGRFAQAQSV
ncbi:MAG: complex I NDUFA9 subunit family protein [Alphaproteobacteria bacterium]